MTDEKMTQSVAVDPVTVTVIKGTGDGTGNMHSGTKAVTAASHQPDLIIQVVTPAAAILIRFVNNYLTMLVGLVTAGMTTDVIPATDFMALVGACAKLSVAGAGLGALKDIVTIFSKLEARFPLLSGNV